MFIIRNRGNGFGVGAGVATVIQPGSLMRNVAATDVIEYRDDATQVWITPAATPGFNTSQAMYFERTNELHMVYLDENNGITGWRSTDSGNNWTISTGHTFFADNVDLSIAVNPGNQDVLVASIRDLLAGAVIYQTFGAGGDGSGALTSVAQASKIVFWANDRFYIVIDNATYSCLLVSSISTLTPLASVAGNRPISAGVGHSSGGTDYVIMGYGRIAAGEAIVNVPLSYAYSSNNGTSWLSGSIPLFDFNPSKFITAMKSVGGKVYFAWVTQSSTGTLRRMGLSVVTNFIGSSGSWQSINFTISNPPLDTGRPYNQFVEIGTDLFLLVHTAINQHIIYKIDTTAVTLAATPLSAGVITTDNTRIG